MIEEMVKVAEILGKKHIYAHLWAGGHSPALASKLQSEIGVEFLEEIPNHYGNGDNSYLVRVKI
jgi:hypothetical protein